MEPDKKLDDLCRGAYPPDGVPFAEVEAIVDRLGLELETRAQSMSALHLAAWAVTCGVCTQAELDEALAAAKARATDATGQLIELRRLLTAFFTRSHSVRIITLKIKPEFEGLLSRPENPPENLNHATRQLAYEIAEALGSEHPCCTIFRAAGEVSCGRLMEADLWALVSRARAFGPDRQHGAFHALLEFYLLGRKLASIATAAKPPAGMVPVNRLVPSLN